MYQMKEKDKTPEKQLNEVEIGNLAEKEFRIMIVKMIQEHGKRMEAKVKRCKKCSQKKNGGKDREDARNVQQISRRIKEQTNRDEQYNNSNEKYTRRNQ